MIHQATYYYFKPSGKWAYEGEGHFPAELFEPFYRGGKIARDIIARYNEGKHPGLNSYTTNLIIVATPHKDCPHGWPIMIFPGD